MNKIHFVIYAILIILSCYLGDYKYALAMSAVYAIIFWLEAKP